MADKWEIMQAAASLDEFVELPLETQALYFHLVAHAVGTFISAPKAVARGICAKEDSLNQLISADFISFTETGAELNTWPCEILKGSTDGDR